MTQRAVILLHGYNSSPLFMKGIEYSIMSWNLFDQVLNLNVYATLWGYFSVDYSLTSPIIDFDDNDQPILSNSLVEHVYSQIKEKLPRNIDEVYLIGHSMGGLVFRTLIKAVVMKDQDGWLWSVESPKVKALLQFGTPNQGSKLTNMRIVSVLEKIQSAIFVKLIGYPIKLAKSIAHRFSIVDDPLRMDDAESVGKITQLDQMKPGSRFLQWLNTEPTYTNVIPHYVFTGTRNRLYFTNLAWIDSPDKYNKDELLDKIKEEHYEKTVEQIIERIVLDEYKNDKELHALIAMLESEIEPDDIPDEERESYLDFLKIFDDDAYEPNDGLVSLNDAHLPGAEMVDLGEFQGKLSHWGLCLWYLPFKQFKAVETKTKNILEHLVERDNDTS